MPQTLAKQFTIATIGDTATFSPLVEGDWIGFSVQGTLATFTVNFEATIDGSNWTAVACTPVAGGAAVTSAAANGQWWAQVPWAKGFRVRLSASASGSGTVYLAQAADAR